MIEINEGCINSVIHTLYKDPKAFYLNGIENLDPTLHSFIITITDIMDRMINHPNWKNDSKEFISYASLLFGAMAMYHLIRTQIESNELKC